MTTLNRVYLAGNLTRDPVVKQMPSGTPVADLRLAVSERFRRKDGEVVETTCFVDVVAWGKQAEWCGSYLSKGMPLLVEGSLQLDQWDTPAGEHRSRLKVRAQRLQFVGRANGAARTDGEVEDEDEGRGAAAPAAAPAVAADRPAAGARKAGRADRTDRTDKDAQPGAGADMPF
jgi:single-strand DNA-binding protein